MDRLPFLPLFITDFHSDTGHLSSAECGTYMRLIALCWQQPNCQLPDKEEWLLRKLGALDGEAASTVRKVLEEFFVKKRGRWRNAKLSARYKKASNELAHHVTAGRRGGQATARKRRENQSSVASGLLEAKSEPRSSKLEPKPKPKPNLELEELSKPDFLEKLRKVIGPGARLRATYDPWPAVEEWFAWGASEDLILRVVETHTKLPRAKPIYSLRAITPEIDAAIKSQARAPESRVAMPIRMPPGRAGDCLGEIVTVYGESAALAWLGEAEWTDDEVFVFSDFCRSQVDGRFGAVLQQHGFTVSLK